MRPIVVATPAAAGTTVSPTSAGASAAVILDYYLTPGNIALQVTFPNSAVATTQVELTCDDPFATTFASSANWVQHPVLNTLTALSIDNLSIPARAVRLNNTAWTSGTPTLTVIQAGGIT